MASLAEKGVSIDVDGARYNAAHHKRECTVMPEKIEGPGFIWTKTLSSSEAVTMLIGKFPFMQQLIDEDDFELPYAAYECFASEAHRRTQDPAFMKSVGAFIDELADSSDPLLRDILWVSVLGKIAEEPLVALESKKYINPKAAAMLDEVERGYYGRKPLKPQGR